MNYYLLFKLVHLLAVVVFLGNIFTGLYWMYQAHRTGSKFIINHTIKGIIKSDRYFTVPGVIVITAGGIMAAVQGNSPLLGTGWIFWSIVLFTLSGIAFGWRVAPLQRRIYRITLPNAYSDTDFDWVKYNQLYRAWDLWGLVAIVTPLLAMVMMVMKWPVNSIF